MRHSFFPFAVASVCFLSLCVACGNDAGGDDDDLGSSSGSAQTGSSGAVSQSDGGSDVVPAGTVVLSIDGREFPLVLAELPKTMFKETEVVSLTALWTASGVKATTAGFMFDFVGTDGFRPASRDKCKSVVFDAEDFAKGYIELASQRLTWDDDRGFSGCAFVTGLTRVEATLP